MSPDPQAPTVSEGSGSMRVRGAIQGFWHGLSNYVGVISVTILLGAFFTISQSKFLRSDNIINIFESSSPLLLVSVGLTFVLLVGEFDISISGVLALSGVVLGKMIGSDFSPVLAVLICTLGGAATGAFLLGLPVSRFGVSSFILSIALLSLTGGLALLVSSGTEISVYSNHFLHVIGQDRWGGIPVSVIISLVVFALAFIALRYTGYGRRIYAVGGNPEMARLAGINVIAVRMSAFALAGGLSALAGVVEAGRLTAASPVTDAQIGLTAAAAVLLGGTSFRGGKGGVVGSLLGVLFLGVLSNGLVIASISVYWQGIVTGIVLYLSVAVDRYRNGSGGSAGPS
jgi:ribose transport system permease protein